MSAAARLLKSWVRIPPGVWIFVCCNCCVLSGRGLCYELVTRPEESSRLWCVVVCDLETSRMRSPCPALGRSTTPKKKTNKKKHNIIVYDYFIYIYIYIYIILRFRGFRFSLAQGHSLYWLLVRGSSYKIHSKWHSYPPILLCQLYSVPITY